MKKEDLMEEHLIKLDQLVLKLDYFQELMEQDYLQEDLTQVMTVATLRCTRRSSNVRWIR